MENKVSLLVNTLNEYSNLEKNIVPIATFFDEVVVVDMKSNDGSRELINQISNAIFLEIDKMGYVEPARNTGINLCKYDYIFILDADEIPSEKLLDELTKFRTASEKSDLDSVKNMGLLIPRLNRMFEQDIHWGKFSPDNDRQLRFFRRDFVQVSDKIHEGLRFNDGIKVDVLPFSRGSYLYHYHSTTALEFISRLVRYSEFECGNEVGLNSFNVIQALKAFIKEYILNKGFIHGKTGFALAYILSLRAFLKGTK